MRKVGSDTGRKMEKNRSANAPGAQEKPLEDTILRRILCG